MTSMDRRARRLNPIENGAKASTHGDPLPRLLAQLTERAGHPVTIERATSRPWASALFQGRRHVISMRIGGGDATARALRFTQGIEEVEWPLPGHFVADISIDASRSAIDEQWIELSALTIEEW